MPVIDPQTAYNNLLENVGLRVFFQKLASYGIAPANRTEQERLLQLADYIDTAEQADLVKSAETAADPYAGAVSAMENILQQHGLLQDRMVAEEGASIKAAADYLMNDDVLYNSVLSVAGAQADNIRAQMSQAQPA